MKCIPISSPEGAYPYIYLKAIQITWRVITTEPNE